MLYRLKRLQPGGATSLPAIRTPEGEVLTQAEGMAATLAAYWSTVFTAKPVDTTLLPEW